MFRYAIVNRGNYEDFKREIEKENVEICRFAEELEEELEAANDQSYRWYLEQKLLELYKNIKTEDDIIELWRGY